ncbi:MAG: asparagine synthase (glutamine-hydrolyzing) [Kiritimatiellae bacterium]|nr:asparagine synthase (glutamine-hydrolyzing) [Kiritimatiellia bacterium]MDD5523321.1 asparagine synthase (glutamine-hydrolyzing) [Kiritimatiellia bacterium]
MGGICGYIGLNDESSLSRMLGHMVHRGPDDEGKYTELGLGLGSRRLSIIDIKGGHQPLTNENKNIWVVLNGEIYNYRELREELAGKGHQFATQSDTEVLVHLYEEKGEEMAHLLRGMFAIALWDSKQEVFLLIRDRLGIKPLYYSDTEDGGLIFASELDSIREALPASSVSPQAIAQYLTLSYIPAPRTIYKGIRQLMPGQILKEQGETRTIRTYFEPSSLITPSIRTPVRELEQQFRDKLKDSVKSNMASDVPLGLLLSGGLDSASILAMMRSITDGQINTFSIGYKDQADNGFNETAEARILAEKFSTSHTEELLSPDIQDILPKVIKAMGEPFADSSSIVTHLISQIARKSVKVALSGIGGNELFGGYSRHLDIQLAGYYYKSPGFLREFVVNRISSLFPETEPHRDQPSRLKRFLQNGHLPIDKQYVKWITFIPHEWQGPIFAENFRNEVDTQSAVDLFEDMFRQWPARYPADKAMGLDIQTYLPDDLLKMGDRMSMAHSLELRAPFCDHELLAFAMQVSWKRRFTGMQLKGFMKNSFKGILPEQIIKRAKKGFMVPLARWLREPLRDMVHDLLSEHRINQRGYLNPKYVTWLIDKHESGRHNFANQIYALLVLEIWLQQRRSALNDDVTIEL